MAVPPSLIGSFSQPFKKSLKETVDRLKATIQIPFFGSHLVGPDITIPVKIMLQQSFKGVL
ncbi:hypothetical protein QG37_06184 [Candidozyma auris]|uniref:Uncharacterized protein n=1 Tax=Candidozyma auris TaxID=498019 RepID=A0A0L0NUR3_CANAR|nr:hypothetical protein QG37_06184 [[Candida] auris]